MMEVVLTLWILTCLMKQVHSEPHLSEQELELSDEDPKCFSRNETDFTCFWEAPVGKSFEFRYISDESTAEKGCHLKQQHFKEKTLHICSFPPSDVFLFAETHLRVIERDSNKTMYSRVVSVEDQLLLPPPSNISLNPTGDVGQMLVEWSTTNNIYEMQYSVKNISSLVRPVSQNSHKLVSLEPGENCTVQIRAKPRGDFQRFWSAWSNPVTAMVPQNADDIEMRCHTPDLNQILCNWKEDLYDDSRYNFHYRLSNRSSWTSWKLCSRINTSFHQCVLHGKESNVYQFYLSTGKPPFGRTFYAETFSVQKKIQTKPPEGLKPQHEDGRLCLTWNSPLLKISPHLKYQIRYQSLEESEWKDFTAPSLKTKTCLDVHKSSQYTMQVRALPNGYVYDGDWSDWSKPVTAVLRFNKEWVLFVCVPAALLIIALTIIAFFLRYFRRVKKSLWPSVPDLNKVLENMLMDINGPHWESTFNIKQCDEDTATSAVEILPKDFVVKPSKMSTCSLLMECNEKTGENFRENLEMGQDYVILSNDTIPCHTGNDYVYDDALTQLATENTQRCLSSTSTTITECSTNILNLSYLLLTKCSELGEDHSACCQ
ncbi:hypothetical protein DNTS_014614 [Danionella cerebrum]|uniref:Fibronectin type-III domain-containing protein n=1 Tax=Danionella cerebrum TaxID=2873325 RepID=A0A553N1B2_9TELE|nr:hypothetical protein DNTS_014614 [Danionella translucida]